MRNPKFNIGDTVDYKRNDGSFIRECQITRIWITNFQFYYDLVYSIPGLTMTFTYDSCDESDIKFSRNVTIDMIID